MSDNFHPCQLLADILTFIEKRGSIAGAKVAWIGDGNNVCRSWINAALQFGFDLQIACPKGYHPDPVFLKHATTNVDIMTDPRAAVSGCDLVVTDTWFSIGTNTNKEERIKAFTGYCVTEALMREARSDALFMHCLPAYRGTEVSTAVIDGPQSAVWEEAGNRLHAQKALIDFLLSQGEH